MRFYQAFGDLSREMNEPFGGKGAVAQHVPERVGVDVLHRDIANPMISPDAWGLLLGAPALTEAGLAPAGDGQREAGGPKLRSPPSPRRTIADIVNVDDVGVIQRRCRPGLLLETSQ